MFPYYTTYEQLLEAYQAEPVLYAILRDTESAPTEEYYLAIEDLVIEETGGAIIAVDGHAEDFSSLVEMVSSDIQPSQFNFSLSGIPFNESLLNYYVEIWLGAPTLKTNQHTELFSGLIKSGGRPNNRYGVTVQEGIYSKLSNLFLPFLRVRNYITASVPDASLDQFIPIVYGALDQVNDSAGRLKCTHLEASGAAQPHDVMVCQHHEAGAGNYSIDAVYKNGVDIGGAFARSVDSKIIGGVTYYFIIVTVTSCDDDDEIAVDITREMGAGTWTADTPIDAFEYFLINDCGIPAGDLNAASFAAAETICESRLYRLGGKVETPTQVIQIASDWLRSFGCEMVNTGGVWGLRIRDYILDPSPPDITEAAHIADGSFICSESVSEIINRVVYTAAFDAANSELIQGVEDNPASVAQWGIGERSYSFPWAADALTCSDIAQRKVFDFKQPRKRFSLTTFLFGLSVNLLDTVRVTASEFFRRNCEIDRRTLNASNFSVALEGLDVEDLSRQAFLLGADESTAADAPHDLEADDPHNCSVSGSADDGWTLTTTNLGDILTASGGSFAMKGVKVGDLVTLFQLAASGVPANIGVYEVYEGAEVVGTVVTTALTLTVKNATTGAAVAFTGAEVIIEWWIGRRWATANYDQRRQGYLVISAPITAFSPAAADQVFVSSAGHALAVGDFVWIELTTNYNGYFEVINSVPGVEFVIYAVFAGDDATGTWTKGLYSDGAEGKELT